jgi:VIT1/CCC1 family predicted Fe2+/Mn2+ transporter
MKKVAQKQKDNHLEPHNQKSTAKLNWLRASVLGANDGIVSIAGLVAGVAGATDNTQTILMAGVAGVIAGAISMAAGEYVSVSSSRDTEKALLKKEEFELANYPEQELEELAEIYEHKGLSKKTAAIVAKELTANDPYAAHLDAELRIDPDDLTDPWHAAFASSIAFLLGASVPILAVIVSPSTLKIPLTFVSVIIALAITGTLSAKAGDAHIPRAVTRVVLGGALAMVVTYGIGKLFGVSGI